MCELCFWSKALQILSLAPVPTSVLLSWFLQVTVWLGVSKALISRQPELLQHQETSVQGFRCNPGAQSKVSCNPEIWKIQRYFCCYWKLFFNPIYRQSHNSLAWLWAALRGMIVSSWNHMEVGFQWFLSGAFWAFASQKGRLLLEYDTSVSKI